MLWGGPQCLCGDETQKVWYPNGIYECGNVNGRPFSAIFIGVALFYMPYFISAVNLSIFTSSGVENELSYTSDSIDYDTYVEPILGIIQIIGIIAFMRGWILLAKATNPGQQPGAISKGVTHVIGGILAVNIRTFITVIYQTLGLT